MLALSSIILCVTASHQGLCRVTRKCTVSLRLSRRPSRPMLSFQLDSSGVARFGCFDCCLATADRRL